MKICIASVHYLETTFPLAKHLSNLNCNVSVYCILPKGDRDSNVIDYSDCDVRNGFDNRYNDRVFNSKLKRYLDKINIYSYFFPNFRVNPILNIISSIRLAYHININRYDTVHLIGSSQFLFLLHLFLGDKICAQTFHEVTIHDNGKLPLNQKFFLNLMCKKRTNVIFHSEAGKNRFVDYHSNYRGVKSEIKNRLFVIPFSLFETFRCYENEIEKMEDEFRVLFLGRILPYKGVQQLIDSFHLIKNDIKSIRLTIAGSGNIEFLENLNDKNIEVINKYLSNEEIIYLVNRARIIVCPYTSASQSGIPMVAHLYNKPMVATSVGGFKESVENMRTGLLIPPNDVSSLADSIKFLLTNKNLHNTFKKNIFMKYKKSEYSWPEIASKTKRIYQLRNNL